MRRYVPLAVLMLLGVLPVGAQTDWFPPRFEVGAASQLVARVAEIGVEGTGTDEERVTRARGMIRDLATRIDDWGLDGVLELAPELAEIDLPEIEDRTVVAIARYGICSLPLHPELVTTDNERMFIALGEMSVAVVSTFLRHRFIEAGGTDEQLAALLETERMNQLSYDIQEDAERRNYVAAECGPMFTALFGG